MNGQAETVVVVLTPKGRGAVASVLVAGPNATEAVDGLFHAANRRPLAEQSIDAILYGRWQSPKTGEELIVCRRGEDQVEVHCHGGVAAVAAVVNSLVECGCRQMEWQAWAAQSEPDPTVADARIALAEAQTDRTAKILLDQYRGALRGAIDELMTSLAGSQDHTALAQIDDLLCGANVGLHLIQPYRVVLAGRPNVGKSSLMNALAGFQRSIVHDTPGTTRDLVRLAAAFDGWPVELVDTAGLHESRAELEAAGIRLAREALSAADLVILVFDLSATWSSEDETLLRAWPNSLVVHNKCDLAASGDAAARPPGLATSALAGLGIDALAAEIGRQLVPNPPAPDAAVPFTSQQITVLRQVRAALATGDIAAARRELSQLAVDGSG